MQIKEIWEAAPQLDLEGDGFMRIENYHTILEFTEERLTLRMQDMIYEVQGNHLVIRGVTKREIFVEGAICGLQIKREESR